MVKKTLRKKSQTPLPQISPSRKSSTPQIPLPDCQRRHGVATDRGGEGGFETEGGIKDRPSFEFKGRFRRIPRPRRRRSGHNRDSWYKIKTAHFPRERENSPSEPPPAKKPARYSPQEPPSFGFRCHPSSFGPDCSTAALRGLSVEMR